MILVSLPRVKVADSLSISITRLKPIHMVKGFAIPEECIVDILATQEEFDHLLRGGEVPSNLL